MSDEDGFLRAIRGNPRDATTRLAYADWLDERGDPRAEYLRLRHQLAQTEARLADARSRLDPAWLDAVREVPPAAPRRVDLRSGRAIYLSSLRQSAVYDGLTEGPPLQRGNRGFITGLVDRARQDFRTEPHLIRPTERPLEWPGGWSDGFRERVRERFGEPAAIPSVGCVGQFTSLSPARDTARDGSQLVVVWFQDEFGLPIADALAQLRAVDWDRLAVDFSY